MNLYFAKWRSSQFEIHNSRQNIAPHQCRVSTPWCSALGSIIHQPAIRASNKGPDDINGLCQRCYYISRLYKFVRVSENRAALQFLVRLIAFPTTCECSTSSIEIHLWNICNCLLDEFRDMNEWCTSQLTKAVVRYEYRTMAVNSTRVEGRWFMTCNNLINVTSVNANSRARS